jgi:diguanylate cyclase (GGDEF)-like protein
MAKLHMDAMNGDDIVFFEDFTAWGYDYTGLMPLVDSNGNHFAVIGVDIDVQEIRNTITDYTIINITVMLLSMGVFIIVFTYWLNKNITDPISKLEKSVHNLAQKSHEQKDPEQLRFIDPQIHTGNEVEGLANAINQMADDMHEYVLSIVEAEAKVSDLKTQVNYMDMLAYQDSLTRVKNKAWYDKTKERVDEDIENGHAEFAIVMIDLNCLKSINDNYGHERGNEYIFGSCHQICVTYQHSPVFRVGGDEFVVLLEKNDYNNREALLGLLMAAFEESANDESKQPWERYSAAIGMAEFDPSQDLGMDDVFKRADKLMYDNKITMKAARK